jgi:ankyrin repeat protein
MKKREREEVKEQKKNKKSKNNSNMLIYFINGKKIKEAEELILKGTCLDVEIKGQTPLSCAVRHEQSKMINLLIKHGCDFKNSNVALFEAIQNQDFETVKLLVENGMDIHKKKGKITPILQSIRIRNANIVKYLLDKGCDPNKLNSEGISYLLESLICKNFHYSKLLIEYGSEINIKDNNGNSPLYYAIKYRRIELVKLLVQTNPKLDNFILFAVESGNEEILKILIDNDFSINEQDEKGNTALINSILKGNNIISKMLIQGGIDVNLKNKRGNTAIQYACGQQNSTLIHCIFQHGGLISDLKNINQEPKQGDDLFLECLISLGLNENDISKFIIMDDSQLEILHTHPIFLLQPKQFFSLASFQKVEDFVRMCIVCQRLNIFEHLISKMDVNYIFKDGHGLLDLCVLFNAQEIFSILNRGNSMDIMLRNSEGFLPIEIAIMNGNEEFFWILHKIHQRISPLNASLLNRFNRQKYWNLIKRFQIYNNQSSFQDVDIYFTS